MIISQPNISPNDTGRGYNYFEAELTGVPFDVSTLPPLTPMPLAVGEQVTFFAKLVEDTATLSRELEISAQAEMGFGAFKGSASASFKNVLETNSYSLFVVGLVDVKLEKQSYRAVDFAKLRLAPSIADWFKASSDLAQFREEFGDYFVSGYVQGG